MIEVFQNDSISTFLSITIATAIPGCCEACSEVSLPPPRISGLSIAPHNSLDAFGMYATPDCGLSDDPSVLEDIMSYQSTNVHNAEGIYIFIFIISHLLIRKI